MKNTEKSRKLPRKINSKQQLIKFLAKNFKGDNHTVIECEGDVDTQNIAAALDISCWKQEVIV